MASRYDVDQSAFEPIAQIAQATQHLFVQPTTGLVESVHQQDDLLPSTIDDQIERAARREAYAPNEAGGDRPNLHKAEDHEEAPLADGRVVVSLR